MANVILSDVIDIISGGTPKTSESKYWSGGNIDWLSINDFNNGNRFVYSSEKKITELALKESNIKLLNKGDVIISARGTVGVLAQIGKPMCFNQSCFGLRGKKELLDNDFLYYVLKNYIHNLKKKSQGSVFDTINIKSFDLMEIDIPNYASQCDIASVLSVLDQKIELNNHINAELEAMAKTLYDYWFVQFDFPNEDGKPYKSSGGKMVYNTTLKREIPEDWLFKRLSSLTNIITDTVIPEKNASKIFKYFSIPQFDENKIYKIEYGCNIKSNKFRVTENDLLVSKLNPWFNRVVYPMEAEEQICSTEFVVLRTDNFESKSFLYCITTSKPFIDYCSQSSTGTSNSHKRIDPNLIINYAIPFQQQIIEKFSNISNPIIRKIIKNYYENARLVSLRDWLLPMLMNGQVTVK